MQLIGRLPDSAARAQSFSSGSRAVLQMTRIQLHPPGWLAGIALSLCLASGVGGSEMWTDLFEQQQHWLLRGS
jgi:hypothetical protein